MGVGSATCLADAINLRGDNLSTCVCLRSILHTVVGPASYGALPSCVLCMFEVSGCLVDVGQCANDEEPLMCTSSLTFSDDTTRDGLSEAPRAS